MEDWIPIVCFIGVILLIILGVFVSIWVTEIYDNRKKINAILAHLKFEFPEYEAMKQLKKVEKQ